MVHERCMDGAWEVHERCMGGCMDVALSGRKNSFSFVPGMMLSVRNVLMLVVLCKTL